MASKHSDLTPYYAHLVLNRLLEAKGSDVEATPQWMYRLSKNGTVKSSCDLGTGEHRTHAKCTGVVFDGESFAAWAKRYVRKVTEGGTSTTKVDVDALVAEYDEEVTQSEED